MKLIANKALTYNTRRLVPGDQFEAKDKHGKLLVALKRAKVAPQRKAAVVPPPPPKVAEKISEASNGDKLQAAKDEAQRLGIEVDGRWGLSRLQDEIERKKTPDAFQVSHQP